MIRRKKITFIEDNRKFKIQNHFECNYYLGNKKALFYSLRKYYNYLNKDPFYFIPLTFHISKGLEDPEFFKFL
jgi:tubulin--tyrosine ligase